MSGTLGSADANGGPVRHIPVMLAEVLGALAPAPGKVILDGTFGAGGYSRALLDAGATVIGLDRDPTAIAAAKDMLTAYGDRLTLHHTQFSALDRFAPEGGLDGVVLDIGVSSMQIDEAERGFSFGKPAPADMRMDNASGMTAADFLETAGEQELVHAVRDCGEEQVSTRSPNPHSPARVSR